MKTDLKRLSDSEVELTIEASEATLSEIKKKTLKKLQPEVSAAGFRKGKAPLNIVEREVNEDYLKSEFLDDVLNELYNQAVKEQRLRPLSQPKVEIQKFVPFSDVAFKVTVDVVPPIKLGDYTKIKAKRDSVKITKNDVDTVVENLRKRLAEKKTVARAAKLDDEVMVDFHGTDAKGKDVAGASGKDYPLALGSATFIDGFEDNIVGMKADEKKTFTLTFPKDYAHTPLANKDVTFEVTLKEVKEVVLPAEDKKFAEAVGPFKSMDELRTDIEKQLAAQKNEEVDAKLKDEIVEKLVAKSDVTAPQSLVDENIESLLNEFKQNLVYRGITFDEYLRQADQTETEYRSKELEPRARRRVETGLVLAEVSEQENLTVSPEELEIRLQLLRGQHEKDPQMLAELNKPEAINEVASRMMTEKTIDKLVEYATKS